jgi:hypothetical protein
MKRIIVVCATVALGWFNSAVAEDTLRAYEPTAEERRIGEGLALQPMPAGRNAYPSLELLREDPPLSRDDRVALCSAAVPSCLGHVRSGITTVRRVLEQHAAAVARTEDLARYDTWWNPSEPDPEKLQLAPVYLPLLYWPSLAAARFVDGDERAGLETACTQAATMRRLHTTANTLIDSMVTLASAQRAMHLAAEMLAAKAVTTPVPESCRTAMAQAEAGDVDFRAAMAFEWHVARAGLASAGASGHEYLGVDLYALMASERGRAAMLADEPLTEDLDDMAPGRDASRDDPRATVRHGVGYIVRTYSARGAEYIATIRTAGLVLWLDDHPSSRPLQERIATAPEGLRSPRVQVACEGRCLTLASTNPAVPARTWPVAPR